MERVICLAVGYVFGLFQTGYLYGRIVHKDLRQYGSGNSGTTNALRVLGKKAGILVFLGDFLKAVGAVPSDPFLLRSVKAGYDAASCAVWRAWRGAGT